MNTIIADYVTPAHVFSIFSLSVIVPILLVYRHYFRSLEFLQMSFIFAASMYKTAFSSKLFISMNNFDPNFLNFCTTGDMICKLGYQLSFGIILLAIILLIRIFVTLKRCSGTTNLEFEPTYAFFKGFFRFIYLPLVYYASEYLTRESSTFSASNASTSFIASAAIICFSALFPLVQLIGYKCIQT